LDNTEHVAEMRRVFAEANGHRMAIVVHTRLKEMSVGRPPSGSISGATAACRKGCDGPNRASGRSGNYEDSGEAEALGAFADAIAVKDRRMKRDYFDISVMQWESKAELLRLS
jgi:hypothetical protein